MIYLFKRLTAEKIRTFFLSVLFLSIPFSIAGDDFATIGLYLCTIYLFVTGQEKWVFQRMIIGMLLLLAGALLSSLVAENTIAGLRYFREFWRFGLPFLVFFSLKNRSVHPFLRLVLIVSCLIAVYSIVQSATGIDIFRSTNLHDDYKPVGRMWFAVGAFSHHLTYGGVSLILFSIFTPPVFDSSLAWRKRLLYFTGSIFNLTAAFLCMGRSIWLGAMVASATILLLKFRLRTIVIALILLAIGYTIGYNVYTQIDPKQKKKFYTQTTIGRRIDSINAKANIDRLLMWKAASDSIKDNPVFGLGPNNSDSLQPYFDRIAKKEKHRFQHPAAVGVHNIYLQIWIDFGILGLLGFITWWFILLGEIVAVIKKPSPAGNGATSLLTGIFAAFTGILVAGFFENNFRDGEVQTALFTAMGISLALIYQEKKSDLAANTITPGEFDNPALNSRKTGV